MDCHEFGAPDEIINQLTAHLKGKQRDAEGAKAQACLNATTQSALKCGLSVRKRREQSLLTAVRGKTEDSDVEISFFRRQLSALVHCLISLFPVGGKWRFLCSFILKINK